VDRKGRERRIRRTARITNSTTLFVLAKPRAEEMAPAHEDVSPVVVLGISKANN